MVRKPPDSITLLSASGGSFWRASTRGVSAKYHEDAFGFDFLDEPYALCDGLPLCSRHGYIHEPFGVAYNPKGGAHQIELPLHVPAYRH